MSNLKSITAGLLTQSIQAQLLNIGNSINQNKLKIEEAGNYLPGGVMLQDLSTATNLYMNQYGCDSLRYSSEELKAMGPDYFRRFFPLDEMVVIKKQAMAFLAKNDPNSLFSFYQRVKTGKKGAYEWYFTTARFLGNDRHQTINIALPAVALDQALNRARYLVDQNDYYNRHFGKYNRLSKREKEIISLIAEGKNSNYIADFLFISIHTVNNHRKNIIRKLEVSSLAELIRFAMAFGLI